MKKKKENFTVQLEPELVAKIDKLAEKLGMSRGQLMRNCLISGFDDAVMLDRLGVLQAINYTSRLREFKESIYKGEIPLGARDNPEKTIKSESPIMREHDRTL